MLTVGSMEGAGGTRRLQNRGWSPEVQSPAINGFNPLCLCNEASTTTSKPQGSKSLWVGESTEVLGR